MDISTLLIAFGLAMDSFAVSITSGLTMKNPRVRDALDSSFFGSFQAFMPVIGWLAGISILDLISGVDHWIALGLLSLIGCKMIYESTRTEASRKELNPVNGYVLLMLSVATSIDALVVGISLAFLRIFIATPILIIGIVTFLLSFLGVYAGNRIGHFFERKIETLGGLILIGIGIKILFEHLA